MVHKQKIALVANTTWNISNFRKNILKALHEAGFELIVIAPVDEYIDYLTEFPYVKHVPVKHLSRKGINPLQDLLLIAELIHLYRKQKVDLALHYTIKPNLYGSFAARYLGLDNISVITG
ncbi:MAG: glycosyltransferase family 4 protein [Saprospiraceae bacterium]|nr:glycosyltransferase family 4 protein [Saprospiraceae bacterium]